MKKLLVPLYLHSLFAPMAPFICVYGAFFSDIVTKTQVGICLAAWFASRLIFDVPTAIIADKANKKFLFPVSSAIFFIVPLLWLYDTSFATFLIGMFIWGFAGSLVIGKSESYIFEYLDHREKSALFNKVISIFYLCFNVGLIFAGIFAKVIMHKFGGFREVLKFSLIVIAIDFILCMVLPSVNIKLTEKEHKKYLKEMLPKGSTALLALTFIWRNKTLLLESLTYAFVITIFNIFVEMDQVIYKNVGFNLDDIGIIIAFAALCRIIGNLISFKIGTIAAINSLRFLIFASSVLVVLSYFFNKSIVFGLYLFFGSFACIYNALTTQIQHQLPRKIRATTFSISITFSNIMGVILMFLIPFIAEHSSWRISLLFIFGLSFVYYTSMFFVLRKELEREKK